MLKPFRGFIAKLSDRAGRIQVAGLKLSMQQSLTRQQPEKDPQNTIYSRNVPPSAQPSRLKTNIFLFGNMSLWISIYLVRAKSACVRARICTLEF